VEQVMARDQLDKGVIDKLCGAATLHGDPKARQHRLDVGIPKAAQVAGDGRTLPGADRRVRLPDQVFDDAGGVDLPRAGKGKERPQLHGGELPEILGIVGNALGR
jgi:hypothetical protein